LDERQRLPDTIRRTTNFAFSIERAEDFCTYCAAYRVSRNSFQPDATVPALILVGSLMLAAITEVHWHEPLVAVPAFLTLILIPFTYSIANGLGFGIIAWAVLHLFAGKARRQDWLLYILAALFLARFIYLGAS